MEFIYASTLKKQFSVFGHFYDLDIQGEIFNCRSVLEIIATSNEKPFESIPCATVVMMNPGSSKPLDNTYKPIKYTTNEILSKKWEKEIIPTKPDNAQYQIMRLMLIKGWEHVRILNLSDLRNGNSGKFSTEYVNSLKLDATCPHSLTNENRLAELKAYCSESSIVIAAWGSNKVLRNAALIFIDKINNISGIPLDEPWYKYPSPYKKEQKLDWLKNISVELKT
jgi:hypothetical protein